MLRIPHARCPSSHKREDQKTAAGARRPITECKQKNPRSLNRNGEMEKPFQPLMSQGYRLWRSNSEPTTTYYKASVPCLTHNTTISLLVDIVAGFLHVWPPSFNITSRWSSLRAKNRPLSGPPMQSSSRTPSVSQTRIVKAKIRTPMMHHDQIGRISRSPFTCRLPPSLSWRVFAPSMLPYLVSQYP